MTNRRAAGRFMFMLAAFIFSVFGFLGTCSINNGIAPHQKETSN